MLDAFEFVAEDLMKIEILEYNPFVGFSNQRHICSKPKMRLLAPPGLGYGCKDVIMRRNSFIWQDAAFHHVAVMSSQA